MIFFALVSGLIMLLSSLLIYKFSSIHHENGTGYFKRCIGVDIDGVLNNHEITFVEICNKINGTSLKPSDITTLPIHNSGVISQTEYKLEN